MGRQIIKQPNGKYAVWSSIVDKFILWDCTVEDLIEEDMKEHREHVTKAITEICHRLDEGDTTVYYQFTMTWKEAIRDIKYHHGKDDKMLADFREAGLIK